MDLILKNAKVLTMDPAGDHTKVIDLGGNRNRLPLEDHSVRSKIRTS